jgi:hypothetical protein
VNRAERHHPPRLGENVESTLGELRLTLGRLENDTKSLHDRNRGLEAELAAAHSEIESFRARNHDLEAALAATRTEIEAQVRRLKGNLLDAMRSAIADFDHAISPVEHGEGLFPGVPEAVSGEAAAEPAATPASPPQPLPAPTSPAAPASAEGTPRPLLAVPAQDLPAEQAPDPDTAVPAQLPLPPDVASIPGGPPPLPMELLRAPVAAAPSAAAPPVTPSPVPPPPATPAPVAATPLAAQPEERPFETRVELDAGPFSDFAALSAFERLLAHLPKVEDVCVCRLEDDRALIELTLSEPAALLESIRESLPYALDVRSANRSKLVVDIASG